MKRLSSFFVNSGSLLLQQFLIWPVRYNFDGHEFQNSLKGIFCTRSNLSLNGSTINGQFDQKEISFKPKMISFSFVLVAFGFFHLSYLTALKYRLKKFQFILIWSALIIYQINKWCISKKFSVPRRQINLLNLKSQYIYGIFYGIWVFGDQMKILLLQVYYNQIGGAENVFTVWWIHDVCEFLGKNV